jgi:hypothetical protein
VTLEPDATGGRVEQAFDGTDRVDTPQVGVPLDRSR